MQLLFEGGVYSKEIWLHTHRDIYSQSRVLTWHGTVPPSVSPLDSGTEYGIPWGLARTADCVCSAARLTAACQWIRSLKGVITNSKSPENLGERTDTLSLLILLTMPVLAHTLWAGVKTLKVSK